MYLIYFTVEGVFMFISFFQQYMLSLQMYLSVFLNSVLKQKWKMPRWRLTVSPHSKCLQFTIMYYKEKQQILRFQEFNKRMKD